MSQSIGASPGRESRARVPGMWTRWSNKMHILNRWLTAAGTTAVLAVTSVAQTWDLPGTTQLLSGREYDATGTAALVVANNQL